MKKNLFILPLVALSIVSVTAACAPSFGGNDQDKTSSHEIGPNDGRHHIADLHGGNYNEGLLTFDNPNTPVEVKGGGLNNQFQNATDETLKYDYRMLGDNNYFERIDYMPTTGDVNLLVIPVKFADFDKNATENVRQRIFKAYFGTEKDTGYESVATYFEKASYGTLNLNGVVTDWYECDWGSNIYSEVETSKLTNEAFEWYKEKYNTTGDEFDVDDDGFVDAICLIYNAPVHHNNNDHLWAYCYWTQPKKDGTKEHPIPNAFFFASVSFMTIKEKEPRDPIKIDTHTYIHELGHAMGLDDYYTYDTLLKSNGYPYRPGCTGGFMMQDNNVGDHDPFSKLAFGWTKPTLVKGSTTITLNSFEQSGEVLIFKPDRTKMESPFDEYIMVDLYSPTGLNEQDSKYLIEPGFVKGPRVSGIRVWHVDARLLEYTLTGVDPYGAHLTNKINPGLNLYDLAMSNSEGLTPMGEGQSSAVKEFRKYKLLHLIQAGGQNTYKEGALMSKGDLFTEGDHFSMMDYANFFVNNGKFNSGASLNFRIDVKSIKNGQAVLEVKM